jgi:hypothetical protein
MSQFTVRVELHHATSADYDTLHDKLDFYGFSREIAGTDASGIGGTWILPTAEYDYSDDTKTAPEVRDLVKLLADSVKIGAWVLVTEVKTRSWTTKKIRSNR